MRKYCRQREIRWAHNGENGEDWKSKPSHFYWGEIFSHPKTLNQLISQARVERHKFNFAFLLAMVSVWKHFPLSFTPFVFERKLPHIFHHRVERIFLWRNLLFYRNLKEKWVLRFRFGLKMGEKNHLPRGFVRKWLINNSDGWEKVNTKWILTLN